MMTTSHRVTFDARVVLANRDSAADLTRGESPVYSACGDSGLSAGPFEAAVR